MAQVAQQIPAEWKIKMISELCQILSGSTPKTSENKYWDGTIPWFTPLDLSKIDNRYVKKSLRLITEDGFKACSAQKIPPYSLIMSSRAPIGYFAINLEEATTNQGCKTFVCSKEVNVDFLYYYLNCYIDQIKRLGSGSTFAEVNKKQLESLEVVIPPLPEQTRITTILSKVDEEIEKVEQIIEQTEKLKKSLMQKLLTKGIGHTKFKQSELGEIPEEWGVVRIGSICNCIVPGRNKPKIFDGDIPWITIPNLKNCTIIIDDLTPLISETELKKCGNKIIPVNSIIMSCVGDFGKIAIVDQEIVINQQLHAFLPSKSITPKFLKYVLLSQKNWMESVATKTSVPYLNKTNCNSIPIVLPSLNEQKQIAAILSKVDARTLINQSIKSKLLKLKKGLMNDLLSGEIRVTK